MKRRQVLGIAAAGGLGLLTTPAVADVGRSDPTSPEASGASPTTTILPGTPHETGVYVARGDEEGPTAMVVGGIHGDERPGYRAAGRFTGVEPAAGTVVVVPRANRVAVERDQRTGEHGDLNRKFPTGDSPTTSLARAVWGVVERYDPDVVVDLHRSVGIYGRHDASVGQAIFPTDDGDAPAVAADVVEALNADVVPWSMPYHDFGLGNTLTGSRPMLIHKVAGDLNQPGYIVETTRFLVDLETQTRWLTQATTGLLSRHGVDYGEASPAVRGGDWL